MVSRSIDYARTFLFVPGNRPERFSKALQAGADAVVLDLEDAVGPHDKHDARSAIGSAWSALATSGVPLVVRINNVGTALGQHDVNWLKTLSGDLNVMVPKAHCPQALGQLHMHLPRAALVPLIETAQGYIALDTLAAVPGVSRLALGHLDFMADTGLRCSEDQSELTPLRFAMAMATRLQNLAPPIDGVTVSLQDEEQLQRDVKRALGFGFDGKLCIHPRQVAVVHQAMLPTAEELDWAKRVLAADQSAGGGAAQVDGKMVDQPVVWQAQRLLARAKPQYAVGST